MFKKISTKVGYIIASLVLLTAQVTPFFVFAPKAGAATNPNSVDYWCNSGVKFDTGAVGTHAQAPITVSISNNSQTNKTELTSATSTSVTITKIVVKGGSEGGDGNGNVVYNPAFVFPLIAPNNGGGNQADISHVIVCYEPKQTTLTVKKVLSPSGDTGVFDLYVNGDIDANRVIDNGGNGATSSPLTIPDNASFEVKERAGTGSVSLTDYSTVIECKNQDNIVLGNDTSNASTVRSMMIPDNKINPGDQITCIFTNTKKVSEPETGTLVVKKALNIHTDRSETPSSFSFKVNGGSPVSFITTGFDSGENSVTVPVGQYSVSEVQENTNNFETSYDNCYQVAVVKGQTTTCTITNEDTLPSLNITKNVINDDNYGTRMAGDFDLYVNGTGPLTDPRKGGGDITGSSVTYLHPNTVVGVPYTVTETNDSKYNASSVVCIDLDTKQIVSHPVTLQMGQHVECSITNNDKKAPVTVVATKIVCDKEPSLPGYGTGGPNITSTTAIDWVTNNSGCKLTQGWNFEYAFNDAANPGDNLGDTAWTNFGPTDVNGQTSVQFDDLTGKNQIWIREQLKDGYLGFTYNTPGGNSNDISAEIYCNQDVLNYDNYDFIDNLSYGSTYYCVAWNVQQQARIRVHKTVINDNSEVEAKSEDFKFTVNGLNEQNFEVAGKAVEFNVAPGSYSIAELTSNGYTMSSDGCAVVAVGGQTYDCYITNNDIAPTLTVVKNVVNDNGGTAKVSDFKIKNNGSNLTFGSGVVNGSTVTYTSTPTVKANKDYNLSEIDYPGYTEGNWSCTDQTTGANRTVTVNLARGENVVCTITNNDQPATLTLYKKVINNNGGTLKPENFPLTISGQQGTFTSGQTVELSAGIYNVGEVAQSGYLPLGWDWLTGGDCSLTGLVKVSNGKHYKCTITNDDLPGKIIVHKTVINDNGGVKKAKDFQYQIDNGSWQNFSIFGINFEIVNAGTHNITEKEDAGYATTYSEDCKNVVVHNGEIKNCYITNNDKTPPAEEPEVPTVTVIKCLNSECIKTREQQAFHFVIYNNNQQYAGFTLSDNGMYNTVNGLKPGSVEIIEDETPGWNLNSSNCYYEAYDGDFKYKQYVGTDFTAASGVDYICYFYNEKEPGSDEEPEPEHTIVTSVEPICVNNFPYLRWSVKPTGFVPTQFKFEWFTVAGNEAGTPAGTLVDTQIFTPASPVVSYNSVTNTYSATTLWPGADDNPLDQDWPGWTLVDGLWIADPSDFGGNLRNSANVVLSVNPVVQAPATYPPATPECDPNPKNGAVLGASTTTLAKTGTDQKFATVVGLSLIVFAMISTLSTKKIEKISNIPENNG